MKTARPIAAVGICLKVAGFAVALTLSGNSFEGGRFDSFLPQLNRRIGTSTPPKMAPETRSKTPFRKKLRPCEHGRLALKGTPAGCCSLRRKSASSGTLSVIVQHS